MRRDQRVELAEPADRAAPATRIAADAAGMQERLVLAGRDAPVEPERVEQPRRARPWPRRSRPPAGSASRQVGGADGPDQQRTEVVGLARELAAPAPGSAGRPRRPRTAAACPRRARGCAARRRAASRAASCAAATARPTSGSRARHVRCRPRGRAQPAGEVGAGEAPADDLVQPLSGRARRPRGGAAAGAASGGRTAPWRDGQRRRELLEPVEPRDLLDQVGLAA